MLDRLLGGGAGALVGFRTCSWPIQIAREQERITQDQWLAIQAYDELVEIAEIRSRRDSTMLDIVSGGGGYPISDAKGEAIKRLVSIDSRLSTKDRQIARDLCAGWAPHDAIKRAFGNGYRKAVTERIQGALNALAQAMVNAKHAGYSFAMHTSPGTVRIRTTKKGN